MAPPHKNMKSEDGSKSSKKTLISQFFKWKNLGRCLNAHARCTDTISFAGGVERKRGLVHGHSASQKKKKGKGYATAAAIDLGGAEKIKSESEVCRSTLKPKAR
jgi:hypothetical protein